MASAGVGGGAFGVAVASSSPGTSTVRSARGSRTIVVFQGCLPGAVASTTCSPGSTGSAALVATVTPSSATASPAGGEAALTERRASLGERASA